ncbi:MAG: SRPBCC family protein [Solirubrobacteraceae bacterium]
MKLEQSFEVKAPLQRVWEALIDVERVAPCLPGAVVTGRNPDGSYNGEFKVKIGPTSAAYTGKLQMEDVDAAKHSATMQAAGTDKRGQGGAKATIVSSVTEAAAGATTVNVSTDYHITGRLARFGRGGMIEEISNRLLGEFAKSLQQMVAQGGDEPAPSAEAVQAAQVVAAQSAETEVDTASAKPQPAAAEAAEAAPNGGGPESLSGASAGAAAPPSPPPVSASAAGSSWSGPPTESEPLDGLALIGKVMLNQAKSNPAPFVAAVVGLLVALRLLRRRG